MGSGRREGGTLHYRCVVVDCLTLPIRWSEELMLVLLGQAGKVRPGVAVCLVDSQVW